ncbi:MAG: hypothetical protein J5689_01400 [Clostridia bacterium]|nr:hypothetical protein [Clostridia bacterium]
MIIGCDIDHTITDSEELENKYVQEFLKSINFSGQIVKPDEFFILARYGFKDSVCWEFYDTFGPALLSNTPIKQDCDKVIHSLREKGDKFIFISARGETHMLNHNPYVITHKWMKQRGIEYDKLICRDHKKIEPALKNEVDLFIDDSIDVCSDFSKIGIPTILVTASHNKSITNLPSGCNRADNWNQVAALIEKIREEKESLVK